MTGDVARPMVLVTGGAGYIGSHTVLALQAAGFQPLIFDNLCAGHRDLVEMVLKVPLIVGDIRDPAALAHVFQSYPIEAVLHFAAHTSVGDSVRDPGAYYDNNAVGSLVLMRAMTAAGIPRLVFSSSAAVYGIPQHIPIPEDHPHHPVNPYGQSKSIVETWLRDFAQAHGLQSVSLRYFNAAGADPGARLGEDHHPETHLIPLVLLAALGRRDGIAIYGSDYDTPDGTCVRDYVHVCDLATAHVLALQHLLNGGSSLACNLSLGCGFSVREVIELAQTITGQGIPITLADRRVGDPGILVGSSGQAQAILGWDPQYPQLEAILRHAWAWHQRRHGG